MNRQEIIEMLEYCGLSYSNLQAKVKNQKLIFINDEKTDVQCFIRQNSDKLVIVFRGSDSLKDWITNFAFWKKKIPYDNISSKIRVHTGFINAYKARGVRDKIQSFITNNIDKIQITGHSYGAALAVLCAVDLQYTFSDKDYEVVLFGCPRVGNSDFVKSYNKRVFKTLRIENEYDIITKLPFAILGFRHVGAKIKLGHRSLYKVFSLRYHTLQRYYSGIWKI